MVVVVLDSRQPQGLTRQPQDPSRKPRRGMVVVVVLVLVVDVASRQFQDHPRSSRNPFQQFPRPSMVHTYLYIWPCSQKGTVLGIAFSVKRSAEGAKLRDLREISQSPKRITSFLFRPELLT